MNLQEFQTAVASLSFGKTLPTARYLYAPDESALPEPVSSLVGKLRQRLALDASFNNIKLSPPMLNPLSSPDTFWPAPDSTRT